MKSLFVILAGLAGSWHFMDLDSESMLYSGFAPLCLLGFVIALALWLVLKAGFGARTSGSGGFLDGGGDGGGCD